MRVAHAFRMTARRWQNIAKYFFDLSKLILGISVIGQLIVEEIRLKQIALGILTGVGFVIVGIVIDRRGDDRK